MTNGCMPTAAAMRTANAIAEYIKSEQYLDDCENEDERGTAEIIEREIGLTEIIETLERVFKVITCVWDEPKKCLCLHCRAKKLLQRLVPK